MQWNRENWYAFCAIISVITAQAGAANAATPEYGSLSNLDAREWYVRNVRDIGNRIDKSLPLEAQARQASGLRNLYKEIARDAMYDKTQAAVLDVSLPIQPFDKFVGIYTLHVDL